MDIFAALHKRRSVRKYTPGAVTEKETRTLLDAAMIAPSAGNAQPWQFIVVDDSALLARIPEINPYGAMAAKAPLAVLVCGDTAAEKYSGFWVQDCAAATQNLLLAATGLGLGAVWTGIYPVEERVRAFAALFKLPEHIIPLALIVIGRPTAEPEAKSRFEAAKVHRNAFGQPY